MELKGALVDLGHKSALDLLLKEAWNPEVGSDEEFHFADGLGGNVIFIDRENTFRSERIFQIAEHMGISPDEILRRIYVCKIYNTSHLEK